jgi:MFS family permease
VSNIRLGTPNNTKHIPEQLGFVMMGFTLGCLFGPPIGGALNDKLGYRAPFIFGMIFCAIDLIGRLFVIEKDVAAPWIAGEPSIEAGAGLGMSMVSGENVFDSRALSSKESTAIPIVHSQSHNQTRQFKACIQCIPKCLHLRVGSFGNCKNRLSSLTA